MKRLLAVLSICAGIVSAVAIAPWNSAFASNLGAFPATFVYGSGAPALTCSATSYNGTFYGDTASLNVYLCSNGTSGGYAWRQVGGGGSPGTPVGSPQYNGGSSTFVGALNEQIFQAGVNGAACDDSTDDTSAFNAVLSTLYTAGGGTVKVQGTCLISGQVTLPNNGGSSNPTQPTIRITGSGSSANGGFSSSIFSSPSVLDLRYNATYGKIETLALGLLEIDHLTLKDGGSDCAAFVYTTNTTVAIHDNLVSGTATGTSACNDAIIFGGTTAYTTPLTLSPTAAFSGYGSYAQHNFFDKIRRGGWFQQSANAITFKDNTFSATCGSTSSAAAVELGFGSGGTNQTQNNVFSGNLYETTNYPYTVWLNGAQTSGNYFSGETFWDNTGIPLFIFHFTNGATLNVAYVSTDATITYANLSDDNPIVSPYNAVMDQNWQNSVALAAINGRLCNNSSGSGTAQSCSTGIPFVPAIGMWIIYRTTTSNSGTGLTLNVNGAGAAPVSKNGINTTLVPGDICTGSPEPGIPMFFDGTNWEAQTVCNTAAGGGVTAVTGTAPVVSSGGATPVISMHVADGSDNGYLASADWSTFNGKQAALGYTPAHSGANSDILSLAGLTTPLSVAQGGNGTASPGIQAGANVTVTGTWPTQTVAASGGGGGSGAWTNITGSVTATGCTVSSGACAVSGSSTSAVEFSVIPGSYNRLQLIIWGQASATAHIKGTFNSDTGSNYANNGYYQIGSTAPTENQLTSAAYCPFGELPAATAVAGGWVFDIPFYANTSFGKVTVGHGNLMFSPSSSSNTDETDSCSWNSTAAITSITLTLSTGDYTNGTLLMLLGQN